MAKRPPSVPVAIRETLIERLEIATFAGTLELTAGQWAGVLHALFPEDFRAAPPRKPTQTTPKTDARLAAYAARAARREPIHHPGDLQGDDESRKGLRSSWTNGSGAVVSGWAGDDDDPLLN